jgi:hypothetical protein
MKKVRRTLRTMSLLLMTLLSSESHYKDKEESKTILTMMCYRLSNDEQERKLRDLQDEPYTSSNVKKMFTPTAKQLKLEIMRCATAQRVKAPTSSCHTK